MLEKKLTVILKSGIQIEHSMSVQSEEHYDCRAALKFQGYQRWRFVF